MRLRPGIKLQSETIGTGREARRGDKVTVCYDLSLNRGDPVQSVDSYSFVLGKREVIAGLEYGVEGMCVGGHRQFRASPHLAYREDGVENVIPPNAVLVFAVDLLAVERES